jgi:hypothetical protein
LTAPLLEVELSRGIFLERGFNHGATYNLPVRRDLAQEHLIDVDRHADAPTYL